MFGCVLVLSGMDALMLTACGCRSWASITGSSADLWSLGILMYEMYCGFTPFADDEDVEEDYIYERIMTEDLTVRYYIG